MYDPRVMEIINDLLESMNDSIIIDKDENIIFFSESYARDANIKAADVIGKKVRDVIRNTRLHLILESGEEEIAEGISAEIQTDDNKASVSVTPYHICNRIPIKKNGSSDGEILGAFAYTSLANEMQLKKMNEQLKNMRAHDKMIAQHLNEAYQPKYMIDSIIGQSPAILRLKDTILRFAPSDVTVLITGETGTGKELIAGAIHGSSLRRNKIFIKINCASIPDNLLESELFGYEPGSFTGALKTGKIGKFELANGGTILLDEIGEMPLALQAKLLRVLQEKEIERIGGKRPIPLDVRVICSTNRDLRELVNKGLFREDLFYRINVMEIEAPPLRERIEDIPMLCKYFIENDLNNSLTQVRSISPEVFLFLNSYHWPGNVRELEHVIECACLMADSDVLTESSFDFLKRRIRNGSRPDPLLSQGDSAQISASFVPDSFLINDDKVFSVSDQTYAADLAAESERDVISLAESAKNAEREAIVRAMEICHYKVTDVARYLGTNRSSLYRKLKEYKIFPYDK